MKKFRTILALSIGLIACAALKPVDSTEPIKEPIKSIDKTTPIVAVTVPIASTVVAASGDEKWVAPAEADAIKNPLEPTEESIAAGLLVYKKSCRSCHGKDGNGKGVGAADTKVPPSDFTNVDFAKQTDGAIHWKIIMGKDDMKSYKGELDEDELWNVINYIRTFSKK